MRSKHRRSVVELNEGNATNWLTYVGIDGHNVTPEGPNRPSSTSSTIHENTPRWECNEAKLQRATRVYGIVFSIHTAQYQCMAATLAQPQRHNDLITFCISFFASTFMKPKCNCVRDAHWLDYEWAAWMCVRWLVWLSVVCWVCVCVCDRW